MLPLVRAHASLLQRFENVYSRLNKTDSNVGATAAHHRLAWIHPFLDGNGRVARLMSHAMSLETLDTGAVWSVARGLARDVEAYKQHLAASDVVRRNDLDGRGHLSEEALAGFTEFYLRICLDQVAFMEGLVQPDRLRTRILLWAEEEIRLDDLPPKSGNVLEAVLYRGELPRADTAGVVGTGERQARRVVSALIEKGVLVSESSRAPVRLVFRQRSLAAGCQDYFRTGFRRSCTRSVGEKRSSNYLGRHRRNSMAYKSIDAVMEAQRDLVDVVHTLRQVVCVKG